MKIIDLLNKISNDEEAPEKVKFGEEIYYKKTDAVEGYVIDYLDDRNNSLFDFNNGYKFCFINSCLEYELEIIEENNNKIKRIPDKDEENRINGFYFSEVERFLGQKINEIIDKLNGDE